MNIVDEDAKKQFSSYDPQAPVTRKGVLTSLKTGRPIEIKEHDMVKENAEIRKYIKLNKLITIYP